MFKTLRKTNIVNTLGVQTAAINGDYREFTVSCNDGTARIIYCQCEWVYLNFTKIATATGYKPKKTLGEITLQAGNTTSFRQMAIRQYSDRHGMVLSANDYYERIYPKMYIRGKKNAVQFTPTAVPDTYGTIAFNTEVDNPTLDCAAPDYSYYPVVIAPVLIETQWKRGACKFYMTKDELEDAGYQQIAFLANKNTEIKIHGGVKTITTQYGDTADEMNWYSVSKMQISDNEILQAVQVTGMTEPKDLLFDNTPKINKIIVQPPTPNLSEQSAQSIADMITASTISGTFVGSAGTYQPIINEAIENSPYWQRQYD